MSCEVEVDVRNIFPGHPPKPLGHTNSGASEILPSDLDPYGNCQWTEKWDEHRVILYNGLAFSRVGDVYSKLPDTYTSEVAKYLEKCFKVHEYFIFDVGFMSHGPMKGTCFLYDIPQHKGTFRERNKVMRACEESFTTTVIGGWFDPEIWLEKGYPYEEEATIRGQVVLPVSGEDMDMTPNELYYNCKSRSHLDQLEGVVGKPWNHVYEWSRTEKIAKERGWLKCRYK